MLGSDAPLPTFLIIGAQKSGTRWLRINAGCHPDVYTAPLETQFFHSPGRFEQLGVEWYRSLFSGWNGESIVGEATPGYMMWRHRPRRVAERIAEVVPDVRLIAILRNPVDRAYSAMIHFEKYGKIPPDSDLVHLIGATPPQHDPLGLVAGGWYAASLKPYRDRFGDQLLVLLHDDVIVDPRGAYQQALAHIGAATDFVPVEVEAILFSNQSARSDSNGASNGRRELPEEDRQRAFAYFREDVQALEKMIDRDLTIWKPGGAYSVELGIDPWKERPVRPRQSRIDVTSLYEATAGWVEGLVRPVSPADYGLPTPCAEWNVGDLLTRIVWLPYLSVAVLRGLEHPAVAEGDWLGSDAAGEYRAAADELLSAMSEPDCMERTVISPFGDVSADLWARFTFINQVGHGWDLAAATGQDATIPAALLEAADRLVRGVFSLMPRQPELFDIEVAVPDSATPTERFVAYLGRDPGTVARGSRD